MDQPKNNEYNSIVDRTTTHEPGQSAHERIAKAAYLIWISEGCPEGREESHWYQAQQQLLIEEGGPNHEDGNAS